MVLSSKICLHFVLIGAALLTSDYDFTNTGQSVRRIMKRESLRLIQEYQKKRGTRNIPLEEKRRLLEEFKEPTG
jgi:hypothetical protein